MTADAGYDIIQQRCSATLTLAGTDAVIGTVHEREGRWSAVAVDYRDIGDAPSRSDAADLVLADWQQRFQGAPVCSPTSTMALARELHQRRGHLSPVRRQRNWLCDCGRDAALLDSTHWLRDVVEALGGTFPAGTR